jgi:hypothetical protein
MSSTWVSLVRLGELIGPEGARILCTYLGGLSLYVGKVPSAALVSLIGQDAATTLCAAFHGEEILLPSELIRRPPIKEQVIACLRAGLSHREVAQQVGCTQRYSQMVAQNTGLKPTPRKKPVAARTDDDGEA